MICTPLEDSPQSRKWANKIYTVLIALSFMSEDFGGDEYLQLAEYHTTRALNNDDQTPYILLNCVLAYWLRMKTFQYHERKGLTKEFLEILNKMECRYKMVPELSGRIRELSDLIEN